MLPPPSTHCSSLSLSCFHSLSLSPLFLLLLLPPLLLPLLLLFLVPPLFLALAKQKVKVKVRVLGPAREKSHKGPARGKKRPERAGRCLRSLRAGCSPWKCPFCIQAPRLVQRLDLSSSAGGQHVRLHAILGSMPWPPVGSCSSDNSDAQLRPKWLRKAMPHASHVFQKSRGKLRQSCFPEK